MKPLQPPTVHVIDDDSSFRTSLGRLLEASGYRFIGYESGTEFLTRLSVAEPGCILLDLQMPGLSGLDLQDRLAEAAPLLPIVFLTGHGDIEKTVRAMKAGAEDFLEKTAPSASLLEVIDRAISRYWSRLSDHSRTAELRELVASLTPRERVVFDLAVRGKRNKEIAFALGTSERTIKAHRHSIMEKLRVGSLAEAVSIAERLGLLDRKH
ncbi:MAG: response regulator transcription factor [Mesorhizobium sp.]|jgi:RNA polymerase sigma factor (sigma-70 family)